MNGKKRLSMSVLTFLLVLTLSAMWTMPVLADDGTPPPTDAPAVTDASSEASPAQEAPAEASPAQQDTPAEAPPAQQDTPSEAPAAEAAPTDPAPVEAPVVEAAPTDPAPVEAPAVEAAPTDPAPSEVPAVEAAPTDPAPSEAPAVEAAPTEPASVDTGSTETNTDAPVLPTDLSQVPTGTDVVVLDATGTVVSMASTEAAQIVATGDPIWCPSTVVTPVSGGSGCSSSFSSFKEVVNWLTANPKTVAGTIWIAKEYDSSVNDLPATVNFTLNGNLLGTTAYYALTLKGGWNGIGTNTIDTLDPSVFSGDSLSILNWKADVTLNDILVTGVTGADSTALHVTTTKNITLTRVNVNDNEGEGARLDDSSGTMSVVVTSSQFNRNHGTTTYTGGLVVYSKGTITLNSVIANDNGSSGARLNNSNTGATGNVVVTSSQFNNNLGTTSDAGGLRVASKGAITLNSVTANGNGYAGAYVYNDYTGSTAGITLTGTNAFNNNGWNGLTEFSYGPITANNVTANDNGLLGANLSNMGAATPQPLTLTGTNNFSNNWSDGLDVFSKGIITLNNLTANGNGLAHYDPATTVGGTGVYVDNAVNPAAPQDVIISGTNVFNGNWLRGLDVQSYGAIALNNATASTNGQGGFTGWGYGALLNNCQYDSGTLLCKTVTPKPVTLSGVSTFSGNDETGLKALSKGAITVNNLTANNNATGWGALLENEYTGAVGGVTVNGSSSFTGNWYDGLSVSSFGAITMNNITSTGNGVSALPDMYGVYADNSAASTPQPFTLTGTNRLDGNFAGGLFVTSKGAITINGLTANSNTGYGAQLNNKFPGISQLVTVNGGTFNGNSWIGTVNGLPVDGLDIQSNLAAKLNSVPMWCPTGVTPGGVGCSVGYANLQDLVAAVGSGFHPAANGVIWIQNTTFEPGGAIVFDGTYSTYWSTWANFSLTLQGGWTGPAATIASNTISTIQDSLSILNWKADVTLNDILITNVSFGDPALSVTTTKNITLTRVNIHDNASAGADLENNGVSGTGTVTISASNFSNNAGGDGLDVWSKGAITLSSVTASGNGDYGAYIDNDEVGGTGAVTVSSSTFSNNVSGNGLSAWSKGAITLNSITANDNGLNGVYLTNQNGTGSVNVNGTSEFARNSGTGLTAFSKGSITLANLNAYQNHNNGVYLDNNVAGTSGSVSVGTTLAGWYNALEDNGNNGLVIYSRGAITLLNIGASGNAYNGAFIDNRNAATPMSVTITKSTFNGNGAYDDGAVNQRGLEVYSKGAITLTEIDANDNRNGDLDGNDIGVYLNNTFGTAGITMSGTNFINNNEQGIKILTNGAVLLNNLVSIGNDGFGAFINNSTASTAQPVTLTGRSEFKFNLQGLEIFSKGLIALNNIIATFNHGTCAECGGAYLNNLASTTNAGVTLTGFNTFSDNSMTGLQVYSKGAVVLNNITASDNGFYDPNGDIRDPLDTDPALDDQYYGYGAYVSNASATPAQTVSLLGSNIFNDNKLSGLEVYSKGQITTNNLIANGNGWYDTVNDLDGTDTVYGYGARLDNTSGLLTAVNVNGVNYFAGNWNSGLHVDSRGAITVNNLTANWNGQENIYNNDADPFDDNDANGAYLDNRWSGATGGVSIVGYSNTEGNREYGLEIYSKGAISLANLNANDNWFKGAHIENAVSAAAPMSVTISGTNNFNNNDSLGLVIKSFGAINLNNITANGNAGPNNAYIDNCRYGTTGCQALTQAPITITGTNSFNNNSGSGNGLYLQSFGNVSINNLSASDNAAYGAYLDNSWINEATIPVNSAGTLTITGYANFENNGLYGVKAFSFGNITIANLNANRNTGGPLTSDNIGGAYLDAAKPGSGVANVVLTGVNNFNDNSFGRGLTVYTDGAITIANLTANQNRNDGGVYLDNQYYGSAASPQAVTITGVNNAFYGNGNSGLYIVSFGAVALNNLTANGNGRYDSGLDQYFGYGAYVSNAGASLAQTVSLIGKNTFNDNKLSGLEVYSKGVITTNNLTTNLNSWYDAVNDLDGTDTVYGYGARLVNTSGLAAVNVNGVNSFNGNWDTGLHVESKGVITVNNLTANQNSENGAYLDNTAYVGLTPPDVTVVGYSKTEGNTEYGLEIHSNGNISLANLTANNNGFKGAHLENIYSSATTPKNVTISGTNVFNNNRSLGLVIKSHGAITLNNITANGNGDWGDPLFYASGAYLASNNFKGITLTGANTFNNNKGNGLYVFSSEAIAIANLTANNNGATGAELFNLYDQKHANVTITGFATTENNGGLVSGSGGAITDGDGLSIFTNGSVSLINVNANRNAGIGTNIHAYDNLLASQGGSAANVSILGTNNFSGNSNNGLAVISDGVITLNNITASKNGGTGAYLDNITEGWWTPLPAVRLNLTGINVFNSNGINGLQLNAYGNVSMTKVTADNNSGNGVLGNTTNGNIALACGNTNRNSGGYGYNLSASGSITLSGVYGYGNFNMPGRAIAPTVTVIRTCPLP